MLPALHPRSPDRRLTYSLDEFNKAFPRENTLIERKSGIGKKPLQEVLVAFTNADGGVILIGVKDDGSLAGRRLTSGTEQEVLDAVADAREVSAPELFEVKVDGVFLVVAAVAPRAAGVAQTSDGRVLVRRGARNRPLFGLDLLHFMQERASEPFDSSDSEVALADVPIEVLAEFQDVYGWDDDELVDGLREQSLLRQDGRHLTVAGALFLLQQPPRRFAKAEIEVRRYLDPDGSAYDVRDTFRGPLHQQVAHALALITRELGREIVLIGAYRQEVPRLPSDVLREALSNAVAHRRYDLSGQRVLVELRPDRVVVRSPGGLVEGVTLARLRSAQAARNDAIITVLRALDLAEDSGRGVDLMEDEMTAALLEPPRFAADEDSFTVTLPLSAVVSREERAWVLGLERRGVISGSDKVIVVAAARRGQVSNGDVRALTRLDSAQVRTSLRRLVDQGVLEVHGQKGGTVYNLREDFVPPLTQTLDRVEAERLLLEAANAEPLTNGAVRALLQVDAQRARALLAGMTERGLLRAEGRTRNRTYVRTESF